VNTHAVNDKLIRKLLKNGDLEVRFDGTVYYKDKVCRYKTSDGYYALNIKSKKLLKNRDCKHVRLYCHRIVFQALLGTLRKDRAINHMDRIKINNDPMNLEQITQRANMRHWHQDEKRKKALDTMLEL